MEKISYLLLAGGAVVALNIGANLIAQRVHPTLTSDWLGRRISYRLVFVLSLFGLIGILLCLLLLLDAVGIPL